MTSLDINHKITCNWLRYIDIFFKYSLKIKTRSFEAEAESPCQINSNCMHLVEQQREHKLHINLFFYCRSPWGIKNGHVQTLVAKLMSYVPCDNITYHRQYIQVGLQLGTDYTLLKLSISVKQC